MTALSQVRCVSGLGSSWSHALFANRPSSTVGSIRKAISSPPADSCGSGGRPVIARLETTTVLGPYAVSGSTPSCSQRRQAASNSGAGAGGNDSCQWANDGECDDPDIGTGACTVMKSAPLA